MCSSWACGDINHDDGASFQGHGHGRGGGKGKLDCPNWHQADDTALLRMVLARRL